MVYTDRTSLKKKKKSLPTNTKLLGYLNQELECNQKTMLVCLILELQ